MANPATIPTPVKDVQGDGRWMSMVSIPPSIPGGVAGPPTVPSQFTLGSLLLYPCDSVPVLQGILQRYSDRHDWKISWGFQSLHYAFFWYEFLESIIGCLI